MPRILVSLPDGEITHELTEDVVTIGRVPDNVLQIDDASVSSYHAQLTLRDGVYILQDLGSTNGTRLDGNNIEPEAEHPLNGNENIRFGHINTTYMTDEGSHSEPLPEESEPVAAVATSSVQPADFSNASPFQKKKKKANPAAMAVFGFAVVAVLAFAAAVASVMALRSPL
jgi:pSer/pThr/pTyr-binding forkhead associated (FHA) protein